MTALKTTEINSFIARPDPARPIVLVHGPDSGLVRERVEALVRGAVDDPTDPFSLARIEGEDLAGNPGRLVEEAHTVPLFGGRRAVWLRVGARHNAAPAVEGLIAAPPQDCRVIIEAGELRKTAPLRALCEKARNAAAIACYPDGERDLAMLIDEEMRAENLTIAPDARTALASLLGGDRLASRGEVRKLALYARGKGRVEIDDVVAVVTDASALNLSGAIDASFAGRIADVERQYRKAIADGTSPGAIVGAAQRQIAQLHKMRLAVDAGASVQDAMYRTPPPVHFSRQKLVQAALQSWSSGQIARAMQQMADVALETRRQPALAEALVERALLALAMGGRRRG
ncbi:MAG TPA: DNA polymerase III subunit delta [Pseudolabrys sp.]|nr:DNA polymerase III subunit delta [Pseudolabrys sp.]